MKPEVSNEISKTIEKLGNQFYQFNEIAELLKDKNVRTQFDELSTFFEKSPEAIHIYNLFTRELEFISSNYYSVVGTAAEVFMEKGPDYMVELIHPEHASIYNKFVLPSMFRQLAIHSAFDDPCNISFVYTSKYKTAKGDYIWLRNNICIVKSAYKKVPHIVASFIININDFKEDDFICFSTFKRRKDGKVELIKAQRFFHYDKLDKFNQKELAILFLITKDFSTEQIASELKLSVPTVYSYRRILCKKMKATNVHQLKHAALGSGLF
ncbi:MAG: LuxR C-terminal-related transcriptional regulator [Flavobacteriales bacterium]